MWCEPPDEQSSTQLLPSRIPQAPHLTNQIHPTHQHQTGFVRTLCIPQLNSGDGLPAPSVTPKKHHGSWISKPKKKKTRRDLGSGVSVLCLSAVPPLRRLSKAILESAPNSLVQLYALVIWAIPGGGAWSGVVSPVSGSVAPRRCPALTW